LFLALAVVGLWWALRPAKESVPVAKASTTETAAVQPAPQGGQPGGDNAPPQQPPGGQPGAPQQPPGGQPVIPQQPPVGQPGVPYAWVLRTARGRGYKQSLSALGLRPQGTLSGRALGAVWFDAPYQTFLAVETLVPGRGWQMERISDILMIR